MKYVTTHELAMDIVEELGIEAKNRIKTKFENYPVKDGKRKIKSFWDSVIVDRDGNEHPYMLDNNCRNDEKLVDFDHIYYERYKDISQVIKETGAKVHTKFVKICEGGGWFSAGFRYTYKDKYCER